MNGRMLLFVIPTDPQRTWKEEGVEEQDSTYISPSCDAEKHAIPVTLHLRPSADHFLLSARVALTLGDLGSSK